MFSLHYFSGDVSWMNFWNVIFALTLLSTRRTGYSALIFSLYSAFVFFQSPKDQKRPVVGLPSRTVRLLMRSRIQLTQAIENFLQYLTVEADQVCEQANQHDLKADDQQDGREDQRLNVPGALLECKIV
jgi:hypothetical protein